MNTKKLFPLSAFLLVALGSIMLVSCASLHKGDIREPAVVPAPDYWPTDGWRTSTPEEQGFDSAKLAEGLRALRNEHVDSLLIIRNGYVILDAAYYPYDKTLIHDLASVTKSITTTLIGIAAEQGKLELDRPMVSYFPDRSIANLNDRKQSITVRNLAGMVSGMQCFSGDEPTLDAMRSQPDWIQAALDRKMARPPGKAFCYDSPGMHILSAILQQTTGMTEQEFAQRNLFIPLGIKDFYWKTDPQGYNHGWGDLWLKPADMAKIGFLFLHHGEWDGQQIVPADWVSEAVLPHAATGEKNSYGYGWWVDDNNYYAMGRRGQYIKVYPAFNAIIVVTASDLDHATLGPIVEKAFLDPANPLPPSAEGTAQLKSVLSEIQQGPVFPAATHLPDTATAISGRTYQCESNDAGITSIRFEFSDLQVSKLYMEQKGQNVSWDIGLDGNYRMTSDGFVRGYWEDDQTFMMQQFSIGMRIREVLFDGATLDVRIPELDMTLSCQAQDQ